MPASSLTAFDTLATGYDQTFSQSLTGSNQRRQSRKWLSNFLKDKKDLNILEINCGTGDDALWLASLGHRVVATDLAEAMITEAKKKQAPGASGQQVSFLQCDFNDLHTQLKDQQFDLIFSNFSGLNCVSPARLGLLNHHFYDLLKPGAPLAIVIFGKYSLWEMAYYGKHFQFGKAFRRWRKKPALLKLKDGLSQPVYYYSVNRFRQLMNQFELLEKKPVGLFIPPSYLENLIKRKPRLFRFLERMENKAGGLSAFSAFADHCYMLLKKKER